MGVLSILTGIGMALGPPLIYADQTYSIIKKRDSTGFSKDVTAVLLIANITRCVFWLGSRFELPLLFQSLALIVAMLVLLFILLKYQKQSVADASERRPLNFWQWTMYGQYIEFLAVLVIVLCGLYIALGGYSWFIDTLGFLALGLESQLPTPQALSNYRRKSCYGLRMSTLGGWFIGDVFKTGYFFVRASPMQFWICGLITVSIDSIIIAQVLTYGSPPPEGEDSERSERDEEQRGLTELRGEDGEEDDDVGREERRVGGTRS